MKVLILNPDGTAETDEIPEDDSEKLRWLADKVGGYVEHVTYLKITMSDDNVLTPERGSMYVNEEGGLPHQNLPFNFLATLLYLENVRQQGKLKGGDYPSIIRGVAVVMPRAET